MSRGGGQITCMVAVATTCEVMSHVKEWKIVGHTSVQ